MKDSSAAARSISAAAKRRDPVALKEASSAYLVAHAALPAKMFSSPLGYHDLGAALLIGQAGQYASTIQDRLWVEPEDGSPAVPFRSVRAEELDAHSLPELFQIRLMHGRWGVMTTPAQLRSAPAWLRKAIRRQNSLLVALAERDARKVNSAIRAFIRDDEHKFSLLGYALFKLARTNRIALKVPKIYDF